MPLNPAQIKSLSNAIKRYRYPRVTYDFGKKVEHCHPNMRSLETLVRQLLTSGDEGLVKDGLSNVLYWGYATQDIQETRVRRFRKKVAPKQLSSLANWLGHNRISEKVVRGLL